jgi:ubiquinone/menaquinone biosynthesis C-methylase UbiE
MSDFSNRFRWAPLAAVSIVLFILVSADPAVWGQDDPDAWEERHNRLQPPGKVMDAIGIREGMVVAEVGAGKGRYAVHMARRVGNGGIVFANDIDAESLDYLTSRCERDGIGNIITILGEIEDPRLPEGRMDVVYMINTYHHLDKPVELMRNIIPSLKPKGILVVIEHDPDKYPGAGSHSTPRDTLEKQAKEAGFEVVEVLTFLERDNIIIFRPVGRQDEGTGE